jgi:hypothetical protein
VAAIVLLLFGVMFVRIPTTLFRTFRRASQTTHRFEDSTLNRVADLRSGSPQRIKGALTPGQAFDAVLVAPAIRLLARAEVFEWARAFLLVHGHRLIGQLVDTLLASDEDLNVRRRIPAILAYTSSQRAMDGLASALEDPCFTIRFNAARALEFLHRVSPELRLNPAALHSAVVQELSGWRHAPSAKSQEYVFSLLAMQLPPKPLKGAYGALSGEDRQLRSLTLEYLESRLSDDLATPAHSIFCGVG